MAYNIFISSNSKDTDLARDLSKRLEKAGVSVITSSGKIDKPEGIKGRIESMKKADEVIFLVTGNAINGKKLLFDMGVATSEGKQMTAIIRGLKPKDLPDIIRDVQSIRYEDLERYIERLQRTVQQSKPAA